MKNKEKKSNINTTLSKTAKFEISEAYKMARTNMMFAISTDEKHTVVFTSCSSHEGKSTTCINMAISLAKTGIKTLLIDGDMRKPTVHRRLKIKSKVGLSNLLGGFCSVDDAIIPSSTENLYVIPAGTIPPNPAELLASKKTGEILTELQGKYDIILIDSPPVDIVVDSLLINPYVSGIVFIVKENSTTHPEIKKVISKIQMVDGKIIGFIKTSCAPKQTSGNYGKYHRRYKNYGKKGSSYVVLDSHSSSDNVTK